MAEAAADGIAWERFYILPHPEVQKYIRGEADDVDRWLRCIARLQAEIRKSSKP